MKSKGQVSIFIILGVVLILLTVVFISTQHNVPAKNSFEVTEKVDEQFSSVQKFVANCLDTTARTGLEKLGSQGGYIDPVASGLLVSYPSSKQPASAFKFIEGSNLIVPYWYYLSSRMDCSGDCSFDSKAPELEGSDPHTIQSQLQNYVDVHIDECLDNFNSLESSGYFVNVTGGHKTSVLIRDNDVRFYLEYPLTVTRGSTVQDISQYVTDEAVPLKPMYNYAALITAAQSQYTFLERQTIAMISLNSGVDVKLLPPSSATTYDYISTLFWMKSRVKLQLQELLSGYIQGLQVANARNYEPKIYTQPGASANTRFAIQRVYDNMVLPLNSSSGVDDKLNIDKRFDVSFEYLNWPIYLDVNSEGDIIKPHSISASDFMFGMQQYDTYYDITYPVRVVLTDPSAFNDAGYTFAFGLQGNIRGSSPLDENYTLLTGQPSAGTFVCNQDQYNSGNSQINVVDNKTGLPISEVSLTFTCGDETCTIGSTDGNGQWSGKLPICGGATLTFVKDETYAQRAVQVSTNLDEALNIGTISLEPYRILNASVEKKLLSKSSSGSWQFSSTPVSLAPKEFAIVSYKQVNAPVGIDPVQGAFIYYGGVGSTDETTVKLVPGFYEVSIQSILDEPLIIPKQERSKKVFFKKIKFTIPEVKMEQFPSGSLVINSSTSYWYVSADDLDNTQTHAVTFYTLSPDIPSIPQANRVVEDLQIIEKANAYIIPNYNSLIPKFGSSDTLFVPTFNQNIAPSVFATLISNFGDIVPGATLEFSANVLGSQTITSYEVLSPSVKAPENIAGTSVFATIPNSAYGPTQVLFKFKLSDGQEANATITVNVRSASNLSSIEAQLGNLPVSYSYIISNATTHILPVKVTASFDDHTTRDITSFVTGHEATNESVVEWDDTNENILIHETGNENITVSYEDQSVEIPIKVTH